MKTFQESKDIVLGSLSTYDLFRSFEMLQFVILVYFWFLIGPNIRSCCVIEPETVDVFTLSRFYVPLTPQGFTIKGGCQPVA